MINFVSDRLVLIIQMKVLPLALFSQIDSDAASHPSEVVPPNTRPDPVALERHLDSCLDAVRVHTAAFDVASGCLAFRAFPAEHSSDD